MTDYAALVRVLKARLGTWQAVADACNDGTLRHSAGYYQQVAIGRIRKPEAAEANKRTAVAETPLKCPRTRDARYSLTVRRSRGLAVNRWRIGHELEWDEWMEKAHELMQERYG